MKASEGKIGRVFVIRLEDGDAIPACIESFAEEKKISAGQVILIGGIGDGQVVVGPRRSNEMPSSAVHKQMYSSLLRGYRLPYSRT